MKHGDDSTDLLSEARRRTLSREEQARLEELVRGLRPKRRILHYAGSRSIATARRAKATTCLSRGSPRVAREALREAGPVRRATPAPARRAARAALAVAGTAGAGVGVVYFVRRRRARAAEVAPRFSALTPSDMRRRFAVPRDRGAPAARWPARGLRRGGDAARGSARARSRSAHAAPSAAANTKPPSVSPRSVRRPCSRRPIKAPRGRFTRRRRVIACSPQRYPGSAEAHLAELSLGKLLLQPSMRAPRSRTSAVPARRARLAPKRCGARRRAEALGRTSEERAALERLLALYPNGAYAKAARKRLGTDAP